MNLSFTHESPYLERPIRIEFELYESMLENLLLDSHDFTLFGYSSVDEFIESGDTSHNKEIFKKFHDQVEMVSGGRLDILINTSDSMLKMLGSLYLETDKTKSVLDRLHDELEHHVGVDELEYVYKITTIEEALNILI